MRSDFLKGTRVWYADAGPQDTGTVMSVHPADADADADADISMTVVWDDDNELDIYSIDQVVKISDEVKA